MLLPQPDSSIVPLSGYTVRFSNELGVGTSVLVKKDTCDYANNDVGDVIETAIADVALDENGRGTYTWRAGLPNIVSPYTRSITVEYINNGNKAKWEHSGFQGIILGEMPSGNNFVTSGPDDIFMVLRDPAGSASSSYIGTKQNSSAPTVGISAHRQLSILHLSILKRVKNRVEPSIVRAVPQQ